MFDYIVVGSGPSGLLVNGELTNANLKGICLEKGPIVKGETKDVYTSNQILNGYSKKGLNLLIGIPPLLLTEGECLGGGSTVNSSLHHRTPKNIWNKWIVKYGLDFDYKNALKLFEEVENKFSLSYGNSQMPEFYKEASKFVNVERIPRWGLEVEGVFQRKTAYDVAKKHYEKSISNIKTGIEVLKVVRESESIFKVFCRNKNSSINNKNHIVYRTKYLFLCAGAGYTPCLLASLGYEHKRLGRFKVHPTARISLVPNTKNDYTEIVEPFQITEYFPELMIGSSANRKFLSEINYPFKKNNHDFDSCLNLYSMAPSDHSGRIITRGLLKGIRFYSLSKEARAKIMEKLVFIHMHTHQQVKLTLKPKIQNILIIF